MKIKDTCNVCGICVSQCPAGAIKITNGEASVNEELCWECYACLRNQFCPINAMEATPLKWPRTLRHTFSAPIAEHKETRVPGRGTEEMKTNDVTGRIRRGEVGFCIDIGRPHVGTTFKDVERIAIAVAKVGVKFEPLNPLSFLFKERTGKLRDEIINERVCSAVLEFKTDIGKLRDVIEALKKAASRIDTVFSVGIWCRVNPDGSVPLFDILKEYGFDPYKNGKTNLALGRPLSCL